MFLQKLALSKQRESNTKSKRNFNIPEGLMCSWTFVQRPCVEIKQEPLVVEMLKNISTI